MIKYQFENETQSISTWIDPESGALCIQSENEIIEIPFSIGLEMLSMLRQKQEAFREKNKKGFWNGLNTIL